MQRIATWLQSNPIIILAMFLISLSSGIAGLILGWNQLYNDYLSKPISLPAWIFLLLLAAIPACLAFKSSTPTTTPKPLKTISGQNFGVQQVTLDGYTFEKCDFNGSELIFNGRNGFSLNKCNLAQTHLTFSEAAGNTVVMLAKIYSDPGIRTLAEQVIENIKKDQFRSNTPPMKH